MLRCAIYARYSSDQQSSASIDDQIRVCREFAHARGWHVPDDGIYRDLAVSGAGRDRPGLLALLDRATAADAPFDALLVDDTSRISRDQADTLRIFAELKYCGRRAIAVSQGIDTANDQAEVLVAVHGIVDSMYVKELAFKTHRGQEGKVLRGLHAGGRCFGYRSERVGEDGTRLAIEEGEAAVVVRIFEMSAGGTSLTGIAKALNAERIPPPRRRAGRSIASWCPSAIRAMLYNERYAGRVVWNRAKFVKRPGTNKRVARPRPRSEWKVIEAQEQRIVTEALWDRVQARLAEVKALYARAGGGRAGLLNRAASSPYLLTGLLKCGECGANLTVVGGFGKRGNPKYGCPQQSERGACGNTTRQAVAEVEKFLLAGLQRTLLHPDVLEFAFQEFIRQLGQEKAATGEKDLRDRRRVVAAEVENLGSAIAASGHSDALLSLLSGRERELRAIDSQLRAAVEVLPDRAAMRKYFDAQMEQVARLVGQDDDIPTQRAELAKRLGTVRMIPEHGRYVAEGKIDLTRSWMVAGARNAPKLPYRFPLAA